MCCRARRAPPSPPKPVSLSSPLETQEAPPTPPAGLPGCLERTRLPRLDQLDADLVRALDEGDSRARAEVPRLDLDEDAAPLQLGNRRVDVGHAQAEVVRAEVAGAGAGQILALTG